VVTAIAGLYLSYHLNLPSGPAMTLVSVVMFGVAFALRRHSFRRA
jgi:ABC-type Mn2+/Zn2+ transport system permease subunit